MGLYYSPERGWYADNQKRDRYDKSVPLPGTGSRPQTYYSPSKGGFFQSYDGKTIAPRSDSFDPSALSNIQNAIQSFQSYVYDREKAYQSTSPKLKEDNREKIADLEAIGADPRKKAPEGFLERTIDVISRPLYALMNPVAERGERAQRINPEFQSRLTPQEREFARREGIGQTDRPVEGFNAGGLGQSFLQKFFDTPDNQMRERVEQKRAETIKDLGEERDFKDDLVASWQGFSGKAKVTSADAIGAWDPEAPNWAKATFGFAGDVLFDPLNAVPMVALGRAAVHGGRVIKSKTPAGQRTAQIAETFSKEGDQLREAFRAELDEGLIDSQLLDRVVTADPLVSGGRRLRAAQKLIEQLGGEYAGRKFADFFTSNLDEAVRAGVIDRATADHFLSNSHFGSLEEAVSSIRSSVRLRKAEEAKNAEYLAKSQQAEEMGANLLDAYKPDVTPPATPREAARLFVDDMMERGRLSQAVGQLNKGGKATTHLKAQIQGLSDKLKGVGIDLDIKKYVDDPRLKGIHAASSGMRRLSNAMKSIIEGKGGVSSRVINESLLRIAQASDGQLKRVITDYLARHSKDTYNAAARAEINRVIDDYMSTVARPSQAAGAPADAVRAWHAGLFDALEKTLNDEVAERIVDRLGIEYGQNPEVIQRLSELYTPKTPKKVEPTPRTDAGIAQLGPAMTDEVKSIAQAARQHVLDSMEEVQGKILELIAKADHLGLDKKTLKSSKALDENLDKLANLDTPLLAERSFNKAVKAFNTLFNAKHGLHPSIDELRLRYMGMSNENIAYRARQLREAFKGTNRKTRKGEYNMFYKHDVDESGRMAYFADRMGEILRAYDGEFSFHSYGPNGKFTMGDLSRWLPEKYKFPKEVLRSKDPINRWDQLMPMIVKQSEYENLDPMEVLWEFTIAHEKAIAEKATLHALADTFGVPRSNLAGSVLSGNRMGYLPIEKKFGDEVVFHPEIARQINRFFELVHSPRPTNPIVKTLDGITDLYKQLTTIYNPVGFNVRNVMGDAFTGFLDGVSGPRGLASYRQASRVLRMRKKISDQALEGIHTPGATQKDLGNVRSTLFRLADGRAVSVEETMALYNKHGLATGFVQTDFGANPLATGRVRKVTSAVREPFQRLAESEADLFRYAHFIDRMKRSKAKSLDEAATEAANAVRKYKFDYNDFTPFEKVVMSRIFPFYKFTRKNLPLMTAMLFAQPAKMMVPPKALSAISQLSGIDSEGLRPTYDASEVLPDWIRNRGMWPVAEYNGDTIYAQPDVQMFDPFNQVSQGKSGIAEMSSPLISIPAEQITGEKFFINETVPIKSREEELAGTLPQTREAYEIIKEGRTDPGNIAQILGFGSRQLTQEDIATELSVREAKFFGSPQGQEYMDNPRTTKLSPAQIRYLISLLAQQNAPERN